MIVTFIERNGTRKAIAAREGATLMEVAVAHGVDGIDAECGGACSCATCHVQIAPEWAAQVGPPSDEEDELLELADNRQPASRLACQIRLDDALNGLEVRIP